jgi:hypothetical protein
MGKVGPPPTPAFLLGIELLYSQISKDTSIPFFVPWPSRGQKSDFSYKLILDMYSLSSTDTYVMDTGTEFPLFEDAAFIAWIGLKMNLLALLYTHALVLRLGAPYMLRLEDVEPAADRCAGALEIRIHPVALESEIPVGEERPV